MAKILPYTAPVWTRGVKNIPDIYIPLAIRPTPIQRWNLPRLPAAFQLSIKRDDLTGSALSGNKIRKLEFLLADALQGGYDSIVTCGGIQSNHCRVSAVAAREVGLKCHLLLRSNERVKDSQCCVANVALNRLAGAQIYLVPPESLEGGLWKRLLKLADRLWEEKKERVYPVPLGGSNHIGTFGYIEAFQEMMNQNVFQDFDDIIMAVGSGGTVAGLCIGNYLTGSKLKVHAVCVCDTADYFYDHIQKAFESCGLGDVQARDTVDLIDGYKGIGYAKSTNEELEQLIEISQSTGILVDPTYNLKAVRGMVAEMDKNPTRFKGSRVLYIHSGGIFSLFDNRLQPLLLNQVKDGAQTFKIWDDQDDDPLAL